jgi:hypothetical protein
MCIGAIWKGDVHTRSKVVRLVRDDSSLLSEKLTGELTRFLLVVSTPDRLPCGKTLALNV